MKDLTKAEWDALYDRMAGGTATYEDAATMWMNTMVGQMSGVSVEEFTTRLRAKYPTPEALAAILKQLVGMLPPEIRPTPTAPGKH